MPLELHHLVYRVHYSQSAWQVFILKFKVGEWRVVSGDSKDWRFEGQERFLLDSRRDFGSESECSGCFMNDYDSSCFLRADKERVPIARVQSSNVDDFAGCSLRGGLVCGFHGFTNHGAPCDECDIC